MFHSWRFKLREAEEALKRGQLDEARRLLEQEGLTEFLPGKRLALRLANQFGRRAREHAEGGALEAAWRDAQTVHQLAGETRPYLALRQALIQVGQQSCERELAANEAAAALKLNDLFLKHGAEAAELRELRQVAQRLQSANHLARRGKYSEADEQLAAALLVRPQLPILQEKRREFQAKHQQLRPLTEALHRALSEQQWSDAVEVADQVLELAPESRLAHDARRRAWARVALRRGPRPNLQVTKEYAPCRTADRAPETMSSRPREERRFALWVDGVGGFLVCLSDELTIGQASPGNAVDVPIQADISRQHAIIRRSGEGYALEPLHRVRVNGRTTTASVLLSDADEIELGEGVRLRFRRPQRVSATARLDFISHHRTQPSVDGVLLMAESCVLGPKRQNHVVCREWSNDVVMYRSDDSILPVRDGTD